MEVQSREPILVTRGKGLGYSGQSSKEKMPKARPKYYQGFVRKVEEREEKELSSERRATQRPRGRRILVLKYSSVTISAESQGMSPWNYLSHDLVKVTHSSFSIYTLMTLSLCKTHTHKFIPHSIFSHSLLNRRHQDGSFITIIQQSPYRIIHMITFLTNATDMLTFKLYL